MATHTDKLDRIKQGLSENTSLGTIVPGTKIHQIAQSVAYEGMLLQKQIEDYTLRNSILSAKGQDLDDIAKNIFGVTRYPFVKSFVTESMKCIKFYVKLGTFGDINRDASGMPSDIFLPQGTSIYGTSNGATVGFRVNKDFILPANASEKFISAELMQGTFDPISSGALNTHSFSQYSQSANKLLLVTNSTAIGSGRQIESDDNLRYRLSKSLKAFPRTTYYGIQDAALSVAGVSKVQLVPSSNGGGTFTLFVQGITPITGDEVVENVRATVSNIVPPWVDFNVIKYFSVGLSLGLTIQSSDNNVNIPKIVEDALSSFINNYYGSQLKLNTLLSIASTAYPTIYSASFNYVNVLKGDTNRSVTEVDLTLPDPIVFISDIEKLIVEPIQNSISINFIG